MRCHVVDELTSVCVLGEISGDMCINVIRIGEDLGGCTVYLALLKECQEDPYGRMKESQGVYVLNKPLWNNYFRQGSHGLPRECPAVAGNTCIWTGA